VSNDRASEEKIRHVLNPFAANWSGTLGKGDLVIPHRDISRLIEQILSILREAQEQHSEASELEVFEVLREAERLPSVQDRARRLRAAFLIAKR
jgi:hypothetical protein